MPTITQSAAGAATRNGGPPLTVALSGIGSVAAAGTGVLTVTVKGLVLGQIIELRPRTQVSAGFVFTQPPYVSAANTLKVLVTNITAGGLTPGDLVCDLFIP